MSIDEKIAFLCCSVHWKKDMYSYNVVRSQEFLEETSSWNINAVQKLSVCLVCHQSLATDLHFGHCSSDAKNSLQPEVFGTQLLKGKRFSFSPFQGTLGVWNVRPSLIMGKTAIILWLSSWKKAANTFWPTSIVFTLEIPPKVHGLGNSRPNTYLIVFRTKCTTGTKNTDAKVGFNLQPLEDIWDGVPKNKGKEGHTRNVCANFEVDRTIPVCMLASDNISSHAPGQTEYVTRGLPWGTSQGTLWEVPPINTVSLELRRCCPACNAACACNTAIRVVPLGQMFVLRFVQKHVCFTKCFLTFFAAGGQVYDTKNNHLDHTMYKPSFKPTQRNVTVGPGDRAVLRCRVENLGTKTVSSLFSSAIACILHHQSALDFPKEHSTLMWDPLKTWLHTSQCCRTKMQKCFSEECRQKWNEVHELRSTNIGNYRPKMRFLEPQRLIFQLHFPGKFALPTAQL